MSDSVGLGAGPVVGTGAGAQRARRGPSTMRRRAPRRRRSAATDDVAGGRDMVGQRPGGRRRAGPPQRRVLARRRPHRRARRRGGARPDPRRPLVRPRTRTRLARLGRLPAHVRPSRRRRPGRGGRGLRRAGRASARSLVVPVTELEAGDGASLSYVSLQILNDAAWSIARLAARGGHGLGRCGPSPSAWVATTTGCEPTSRSTVKGARSEILSAYLGNGTQVHDIRTLQDHVAPRTNSELLCQGAVAGTSRSVYSGLIRVHRGAVRSDARQTNHNLVLDEGCARRLGAQPRHLGERREVLPCLDRRPDRRGPALLHRVAGRDAPTWPRG